MLFLKDKTRAKENGFTLLETLLVIILMAAGFSSLLQAMAIGLFAGKENETELVAVNLAYEKIEELKNRNYLDIVNETKAPVPEYPTFQREVGVITPQAGLKQISVNVYWFTKSSELNASLETYVSDI